MRSILSLTRSEIKEFLDAVVGEYKISFVKIIEEDEQVQVGVVTTWTNDEEEIEIEDVFEFSQDSLCENDYPGSFSVSYRDFLYAKGFQETKFSNIAVHSYQKSLLEHIESIKKDVLHDLTQDGMYDAKMIFDRVTDLLNKDSKALINEYNTNKENRIIKPGHPRWEEFCARLKGPEGCMLKEDSTGEITWKCKGGNDKSFAIEILKTIPEIDIEASLEYIDNHNGHCDCEILFNVDKE